MKKFFNKHKSLFICIGLFLLYFILLSAYKNLINFTDEGDNMLGGMAIARGGHVYTDFPSQHLPFMYYLMSIFSFIGINGTPALRLCFYGVLSLIWTLMYKRYNKEIGKMPLILYPIFYILMMVNVECAHTVLADHIEAQCLVILLLELYLFNKNKKLSNISQIIIGLSIYVSVWSAFVSIIPIMVFVFGMFYIDIENYLKENKKIKRYLKFFISNYYKLLLYTIIPFVLSLVLIILNNSLKEFYTQAFYINTHYYSQYIDYSSNIIMTSLKTIFRYFNYYYGMIHELSFQSLIYWIFFIFNIIFVVVSYKKEKFIIFIIFIFILMSANRGFENFHMIPYLGLSIISFLISTKYIKNINVTKVIIISTLFLLSIEYIPVSHNILKKNIKYDYEIDKKLTSENNYIYYYDLLTDKYVDSGIKSASKFTTLVPWYQPLYEDDVVNDLMINKPNVIYYKPYGVIWETRYYKYAKKLDLYIKKNYSYVSKYKFWIRNDYIEKAEEILEIKIPDYTTAYNEPFILKPIVDNTIVEQTVKFDNNIVNAIDIRFKLHGAYSLVKFSIVDNNNILYEKTMSIDELKNKKYHKFKLSDLSVDVTKTYKIRIESINSTNFDYFTVYATKDKDNFDKNHAIINGIDKKFDLDMNIYYK